MEVRWYVGRREGTEVGRYTGIQVGKQVIRKGGMEVHREVGSQLDNGEPVWPSGKALGW